MGKIITGTTSGIHPVERPDGLYIRRNIYNNIKRMDDYELYKLSLIVKYRNN